MGWGKLLVALACRSASGTPDVDRIEELNTTKVRECYDLARRPSSPRLKEILATPCSLTWGGRPCDSLSMAERAGAGHCEARYHDETQTLYAYADARKMCGVIAGAVKVGAIATTEAGAQTMLIDVGAAWSGEAIVGHKMGFLVAAFEAREVEYQNIVKATRRFRGIDVIHAAVTDKPGPVELHMAADSSSLLAGAVNSLTERAKHNYESKKVVTVPGVVLDEYATLHNARVAFLMIDVQGVEYYVLRGARKILSKSAPVLMFEYDAGLIGPLAPKVLCLAQSFGYECAFQGGNVVCIQP